MLPPAIGGQIRVAGLGLCRSWGAHSVPYWHKQVQGYAWNQLLSTLAANAARPSVVRRLAVFHISQPVEERLHAWKEEAAKSCINTICKHALSMCLVS